jgi:ribulose-phosphate 3-epimerase
MNQNLVSPSILSCDFLNIEKDLKNLEGMEDIWLHLDVMDGHFVPNLTFGGPIISQLQKKTSIPTDVHLMVNNPEFHIKNHKDEGIHNITFHYEAAERDALNIIEFAKEWYPSVGISIKPKTPVSALPAEILSSIDLILVMSVEPGFGGQSFIDATLDKIRELNDLRKKNNYRYQIQIDGGISDKNAKIVREAGADNLVAGSYVFKAGPEQYKNRIDSLR